MGCRAQAPGVAAARQGTAGHVEALPRNACTAVDSMLSVSLTTAC